MFVFCLLFNQCWLVLWKKQIAMMGLATAASPKQTRGTEKRVPNGVKNVGTKQRGGDKADGTTEEILSFSFCA